MVGQSITAVGRHRRSLYRWKTTGVASGITATQHTVPDLDGEIYLKQETGTSVDVNGDGVCEYPRLSDSGKRA